MSERPLRVLVVGNNSGAMHGSLVMTRYLVRALALNGCEVTVLDRAFSRRNTEIGKVKPYKLFRAAFMVLRVIRLALLRRFDAAFYLPASLPPALTFDYYFFPFVKILSKVWIGYSHMVRYRQLKEGTSRFQSMHAQKFWQSFDWCIGPSEVVADDLVSVGVPPEKTRVLLNCLPPGWTFADPDSAVARAAGSPSAILFLSTVRARKGIWDLTEAYGILSSQGMELPDLEIIGPETDIGIFGEIRDWAARNRLEDRVHVVGEMGHREIEARLSDGLPILVFPTRREEAFGLVLAEAMSKGVPVVATNIGAIPEVLLNGTAGLLTEPCNPGLLADSIKRLLDDSSLRVTLALGGIEASRKYSFTEYSEGLGGILRWAGIRG